MTDPTRSTGIAAVPDHSNENGITLANKVQISKSRRLPFAQRQENLSRVHPTTTVRNENQTFFLSHISNHVIHLDFFFHSQFLPAF